MALSVSLVRKKRFTRIRYNKATPDSSFFSLMESLSSDFGDEQEVALCLMLLSRGLCLMLLSRGLGDSFEAKSEGGIMVSYSDEFSGKKPRREINLKNQMFDCDIQMGCNEESRVESGLVLYDHEIHKGIDHDESEASKDYTEEVELKFHCRIYNKNFGTYQALGGHQTCHRATKSFIDVKTQISIQPESEDSSKVEYMKDAAEEEVSTKRKEHKCHICCKNFVSGQALGGHKRAQIAKAKEEQNSTVKQDMYDSGLNEGPHGGDIGSSYKHNGCHVSF